MINRAVLVGRLANDPQTRNFGEGKLVSSFLLAVDRRFSKEKKADFIPCEVWNKQAEVLNKYTKKGSRIGVIGSIRVDTYEIEGEKRYKTFINVEELELLDPPPAKTKEILTKEFEDIPF